MTWRSLAIAAVCGAIAFQACDGILAPAPTAAGRRLAPGVLWATSHERGTLKEWYVDDGGGVFNSGCAEVRVTDEAAHSGRYALRLEVWGIDEGVQAARIFRWGEGLTEGYFSAWYMFPVAPRVSGWLNIFQFKKRAGSAHDAPEIDPTWYNEVRSRPEGIQLTLSHWEREYNIPGNVGPAPVIEAGRWFHVEWYYRDGVEDGALRIWIDGALIWDLAGVDTRGLAAPIQWSAALYGTGVEPSHLVLYVDDAAISTRRLGPQGELFVDAP